jgi:hypothetical protein
MSVRGLSASARAARLFFSLKDRATVSQPTIHRLHDAYDRLMSLPPGERRGELEKLSQSDHALAAQLEPLLAFQQSQYPTSTLLGGFPISGSEDREKQLAADLRDLVACLRWDETQRAFYFGHYAIVDCLSVNARGATYFAFDDQLQREVVLLLTFPRMIGDAVGRQLTIDSARTVAKIFHENVASILGVLEVDGITGIVRQWVPGTSLEQWCRHQGSIRLSQVLKFAIGITRGLAAIHAQWVLHGDLKPANIILRTENQTPVITDFGTTTWLTENDRATWRGGTPGFIAPEILRGEAPTVASDLYSLGVVLHWLITGSTEVAGVGRLSLPDTPASPAEAKAQNAAQANSFQVDSAAPGPSASISAAAQALLVRLLASLPSQRPQSAQEVMAELEALLQACAAGRVSGEAEALFVRQMPRRHWLAHAIVGMATCGSLFTLGSFAGEHARDWGWWRPALDVPGGYPEWKLFAQWNAAGLPETGEVLADLERTWVYEANRHQLLTLFTPRVVGQWAELALEPLQLPTEPLRNARANIYLTFNCPSFSARYEFAVAQAGSHRWRTLLSGENHFGGVYGRHLDAGIPRQLLEPDASLVFRIRLLTRVPWTDRTTPPPIGFRLAWDEEPSGAVVLEVWKQREGEGPHDT